jgi:dTDP-4-dehydrorhamnose 3,5-epimerase
MKHFDTPIEGLKVLEPRVFGDERGFFLESWNQNVFDTLLERKVKFVQDNHSKSQKGTLRGLHIQVVNPQSKLVRVVRGSVLDVAVDLRKGSPTFGKHYSILLSESNKRQLWIPKGFAHGFIALEDDTEFLYKCDDFYDPRSEVSLLWNDSSLNIDWGVHQVSIISSKDCNGLSLEEYKKNYVD